MKKKMQLNYKKNTGTTMTAIPLILLSGFIKKDMKLSLQKNSWETS